MSTEATRARYRASTAKYRASEKGRLTEKAYRQRPEVKAAAAARTNAARKRPEVRERYLTQQRARSANHARRVADLKLAAGCIDCGYNLHPSALDFDHVVGQKVRSVSEMIGGAWSKIEAEMAKCVVRCANCHRIKTHSTSSESLRH